MINPSPVKTSQRIVSLDVLRGFALLGILIVNIQSFAMISGAYNNPTAYGDLRGSNYAVWFGTHLFFDSKMMAIFSMLFGAGITLMYSRAVGQSGKGAWLHYRRMFWLVLFGLAHAHLLWFGDILFAYGVCGMVVFWAKGWRPTWLIVAGLIIIAVPSGLFFFTQASIPSMDEAARIGLANGWQPDQETINAELLTYRGGWLEQMAVRSPTSIFFETFLFLFLFFWRAGGLMLVGMGLFKMNLLDASRSTRFYITTATVSLVLGIPTVLSGIQYNFANNWAFEHSMFGGVQFNYWGGLPIALAYVCCIMLVCKHGYLVWLTRALQATGQMALTNYLMQTIICTFLFYGHGLGMFGSVSRTGQFGIVIAIWALQLCLSPMWLKRFRFGPFEWLWRSLAYWKVQPFKIRSNDSSSQKSQSK